jgi:DNA repair protein RecN (Recombination protein N)
MLVELSVRDLGVIDELSLVLGPGMTAVTGETGAGKTLVVQAIDLLTGGRADPVVVRPGAPEARVEGRFVSAGSERVLARVLPASGRSRAYIDGRMATAAAQAELAIGLVDLHGQHTHQSLLGGRVQRDSLDRFGAVDLAPLLEAKAKVRDLNRRQTELGGDERSRAHEIDLLRFQLAEIETAALERPDEEDRLEGLEDELADAVAHRHAAQEAAAALSGDLGAQDCLGVALSALAGRAPYAALEARLRGVAAELADVAAEVRTVGERIEDDPARLDQVRARRQQLRDLCRKYGDDLGAVLAFAADARGRLEELERHDEVAARLDAELAQAHRDEATAAEAVARGRRAAAPRLSDAVTAHLPDLALERGRLCVEVGGADPADDVAFTFDANGTGTALPLAKVASGGELARVMLGLRLVLTAGPPTLIFDEVDAGIGGAAALAVGRSLSQLAPTHQVLVVTHLPQVAAFADHQVVVSKGTTAAGQVVSTVSPVEGEERVAELTRMLSGRPDSSSGRRHAAELLGVATAARSAAS